MGKKKRRKYKLRGLMVGTGLLERVTGSEDEGEGKNRVCD